MAWDTILGLQLENLVLGSFEAVRQRLGLERVSILNAGTYIQSETRRRRGCQIDLLVRTKRSLYIIEVRLRDTIDASVIDEVKRKVDRLDAKRGLSVRTGLIYVGELTPTIEEEDYFDYIIPFGDLLA